MDWFLENTIRNIILNAEKSGFEPTAEERQEFMASFSGDAPRIMSVADDKAEIKIQGILTKDPDFMAMIFGGGMQVGLSIQRKCVKLILEL